MLGFGLVVGYDGLSPAAKLHLRACARAMLLVPCHSPAQAAPLTLSSRPAQVFERYPGGCSKGELTLEGQRQAREFGKWLRWRYVMVHDGFLPEAHQVGGRAFIGGWWE